MRYPILRIAGGENEPPAAEPPAAEPPAAEPPADPLEAIRGDIAWLKSQFGSSDDRVKALETQLREQAQMQKRTGRKAQSRPTTVRTTMRVEETPPVERPEPRGRRVKRLRWGRKTEPSSMS